MSNSVAEFFSKKGVKTFKNGINAWAGHHAVKIAAASMILAGAFSFSGKAQKLLPERDSIKAVTAYAVMEKGDTLCSYQALMKDSASFERLQKLVNNATKSKTGCDVLKKISQQGTTLYSDFAGVNAIGFFDPNTNSICLNSVFNNGDLQSCLIHEGKHAIQGNALKKGSDAQYDFATNIMTTRVMEADAMATQTKFSYEMAQAGDSIAWKELQQSHKGITRAFENAVQKYSKEDDRTMKETMLAWYNDKQYVRIYDKSIVEFHAVVVSKASDQMIKNCFIQTIPADSLVSKVCSVNGKPYAGKDGSILKTPQTAYLDDVNYASARIIGRCAGIRSPKVDNSADGFYVLKADGLISNKTYGQVNAEEAAKKAEEIKKAQEIKKQKVVPFLVAAAKNSETR